MGVFDENKTAIPVSTGEKIKEFRLNKKLSQIEVSNIMGKSPVWLSKIETDQREIKVQDLIKICKIFQIDITEILGLGKNNMSLQSTLQNVVSKLPVEVPVYSFSELDKLLKTDEPLIPILYAYWDPKILSNSDVLGIFIEDDYNAPEIRKGDRVYVNLDWGNSALTDETFKKRIVDATHWILEILPDSDKQICNICKGQQIRYNRPSFDDEFACLCSEGYTVAKIHTDNKNYVSFHNSKVSLASEKVRIIGRLVQIVKEI
ncbi:MAG: helix-turn-helix transcriptional regulator [Dehalococcoidia bacterium]|nr:helix-turn-helix transcriptional regulator [Dehalococcoidia bacterium]